ncbi:phage tail protein [Serratia symbiotica]|uniref:Phage tail protein n=1 Tax=Serratia symbiotica TaxID=138074 RepID=A0A455VFD5_9GAMM|nr:phage tail protein [Serratia symbiotica]
MLETINLAKNATPSQRKINGKALAQDVQLTATDVHAITPEILRVEIPVGVPLPWPTEIPPAGWRICNGETFNKKKYPLLALAYPSAKLPDLRGEFIRGWDAGRRVDNGRQILSAQGDAMQKIWAQWAMDDQAVSSNFPPKGTFYCDNKDSVSYDATSRNDFWRGYQGHFDSSRITRTAEETRPRNIAFNYIVRAA